MNFQTVSYSGCTIFHSHLQGTRALISSNPSQHLLLSVFSIIVTLMSIQWYLIVGFLFLFILLQLFQFTPLGPPLPSPPPAPSQSPHHCPCPWVIHTCSLTNPFPFFLSFLPPPFPMAAVRLFYVSMSLVLFCSLVYLVH